MNDSLSIHVTSDGLTTHAVLKCGGKVVKRTKAVCNPSDRYSFRVGAELALERLLGVIITHEPAVREVKREAKVGEHIKIVCPAVGHYKTGDIIKITELIGVLRKVARGDNTGPIYPYEYVVLEGYTQ